MLLATTNHKCDGKLGSARLSIREEGLRAKSKRFRRNKHGASCSGKCQVRLGFACPLRWLFEAGGKTLQKSTKWKVSCAVARSGHNGVAIML